MLTANRFDQIKAGVQRLRADATSMPAVAAIADVFQMLIECVDEIERIRAVPQVRGRDHVKPVILDDKGRPVPAAPISSQLAAERREQYALDRHEVLMSMDPAAWRVFSLRWGLAPPPGGWDSTDQITNVMHSVRLSIESIPHFEKHKSALTLKSRGIALPHGVKLEGGVLTGTTSPDAP